MGDAAELLEKKYVTRPRQAKPENVTTQSSRVGSFGDKVIKEAMALSPTTSSAKNSGHMVTISNMRGDVTEEMTALTEEMTALTEEESKMTNDDEENPKLLEVGLGETAVTNMGLVIGSYTKLSSLS